MDRSMRAAVLITAGALLVSGGVSATLWFFQTVSLHPKVLVGTDHWYFGTQYGYYPALEDLTADLELDLPMTTLSAGLIIGSRLKLMPEVSYYVTEHSGSVVMGQVGLQWDFWKGGR